MIAAVVLAAGTSSRLGRTKQLLELDGRPLLQHALDRAAAHFDEVVVVLGHEAGAIEAAVVLPERGRVVRNERYLEGQRTSVRCGLRAAVEGAEAVAILLGDQPRLPGELIERTLAAFRDSPSEVVRPRHQGAPGHPVIVRAATARALARAGDEELERALRGPGVAWVDADPQPPVDVDTWDAYLSLEGHGDG